MHTLVNSVWPNFSTTKLLTKVATKSLVTFSAISKNIIICKKYCFANIWLTFGNIWATFLLPNLVTLQLSFSASQQGREATIKLVEEIFFFLSCANIKFQSSSLRFCEYENASFGLFIRDRQTRGQCDQKKVAKNDFTSKMNAFDTFTKIAKQCVQFG